MDKWQKVALAALIVSAVSSTVTAVQVCRMAKNGFEVELTEKEQAEVIEAMEAAQDDMIEEGEQ